MWRGEAAQTGSLFREFVITSNQFTSTLGTFQVLGLEGASGGIKDGKFAPSDEELKVLMDKDFDGLDSAAKEFERLVVEARQAGFRPLTMMDQLEFEDKLSSSQASS